MSAYESETYESTDLEPRTERALTECMTVLPEGGEIYTVVGENGDTYRVDDRAGRCTCPDHKHRSATCKHQRRVAFAVGECAVPASVDDADDLLGDHVEGGPQTVATDGGIIEAGDDGEILDDQDSETDDGRPEDCDCGDWNADLELPCWPCYRDGFRQPTGAE